jgi:thiamine biosynthesis protein ThiS
VFPGVAASDTVFVFAAPMIIQINGEERKIDPGLSIAQLLEDLGIRPARVVVELNRHVLSREAFTTTALREGDKIEIVHFVGGG